MQCFKRLFPILKYNLQPRVFPTLPKRTDKPSSIVLRFNHELTEEPSEESELEILEYNQLANSTLGSFCGNHRIFLIQPYVKWGKKKKRNTSPQLQMAEAEALIHTLPRWVVVDKMCVPLLSLDRTEVVGKGQLENIRKRIHSAECVSAIFISKNMLNLVQIEELETELGLPVFDRYAIIIHIFRLHAKSPEAKLQVALAEIPYIWKKVIDDNIDGSRINFKETRKRILQDRRVKLKKELDKMQEHRHLVRRRRKLLDIPSVAIVGYTNAGKTSLIKALTGDSSLIPRNQLFATLDTTGHEGFLPSRLKVVYMDTIGFIQDVPEGLLAPFIITFEEAIDCDVIIHVYDVSHPDQNAQVEHVRETLASLNCNDIPIIEIANKCDLVPKDTVPKDIIAISAKKSTGIDLLRRRIEKELLLATGRLHIRMRVASGSEASAWLYRELTVTNAEPDPENLQYIFVDVIATEMQIHKFKRFLKK